MNLSKRNYIDYCILNCDLYYFIHDNNINILMVKHIIRHSQSFGNIKAELEISENLDEALSPDQDNTKICLELTKF